MAYIRVKKIKDREYAYLVKTKWIKSKQQPKQSVSKYLGRVMSFTDPVSVDFWSFMGKDVDGYVSNMEKGKVVGDLVRWEFKKHGIEKVSFGNKSVKMGKKDITLKMNEGFLNGHTLKELLSYKQPRGSEDGYDLAKRFVDAGIKIPQELFIEVFSRKIFK